VEALGSGGYLLFGLLLLICVAFLFAWWQGRNADGSYNGPELAELVLLLVKAAEQVMSNKSGAEKFAWVWAQLDELGWLGRHDDKLLKASIEAAVYDLKQATSVQLSPTLELFGLEETPDGSPLKIGRGRVWVEELISDVEDAPVEN
jgi:hypothetical protein